ncbi:hypothetical protein MJO28_008455 [Puccinia striiformis f. sp. tritici]|uniref:Uncharacterized protein n=3 Tax=Puccinia striiformis TaxID=27350 RepID=A0A0L0UWE7_9BASI|nr:hypothetical protein Pst134EB_016592 [Puccinia striiformis f. sp. tritici]KAI7949634.1 hypothetical protein MJO28_008455 [Puccinia striiformis f. sp. tritici]KAI9602784.1 hypothetical protein H4Q26_002084 [Puccinia striiformis f. sp. tritici PST-130]KNE91350.1 hypothetical protein PSTG_15215 [Puccinia striiformis f. sp. tritici PST-78]
MGHKSSEGLTFRVTDPYENCIQYLEEIVHLLLAKTVSPRPPIVSSAPQASSFRYSVDRGLVPILSEATARSLAIALSDRHTVSYPRTRTPGDCINRRPSPSLTSLLNSGAPITRSLKKTNQDSLPQPLSNRRLSASPDIESPTTVQMKHSTAHSLSLDRRPPPGRPASTIFSCKKLRISAMGPEQHYSACKPLAEIGHRSLSLSPAQAAQAPDLQTPSDDVLKTSFAPTIGSRRSCSLPASESRQSTAKPPSSTMLRSGTNHPGQPLCPSSDLDLSSSSKPTTTVLAMKLPPPSVSATDNSIPSIKLLTRPDPPDSVSLKTTLDRVSPDTPNKPLDDQHSHVNAGVVESDDVLAAPTTPTSITDPIVGPPDSDQSFSPPSLPTRLSTSPPTVVGNLANPTASRDQPFAEIAAVFLHSPEAHASTAITPAKAKPFNVNDRLAVALILQEQPIQTHQSLINLPMDIVLPAQSLCTDSSLDSSNQTTTMLPSTTLNPAPPPATSEELNYLASVSVSAMNVAGEDLTVTLTNGTTIGRYTGIDPVSLAAIWDIPEDNPDEEVASSSETPAIYNLAATGSVSVINPTEVTVGQQPATQYEKILHEAELADYLEYLRENGCLQNHSD